MLFHAFLFCILTNHFLLIPQIWEQNRDKCVKLPSYIHDLVCVCVWEREVLLFYLEVKHDLETKNITVSLNTRESE